MAIILGLDTATAACSAAVWHGDRVAARRFACLNRGHADHIVPMTQDVLAEAGLTHDRLDAIAVTVGPGTFTGVRIGLAAARGLALASRRPLIGLTTLEVVAHGAPAAQRAGRTVLAVLDARRGQVYGQSFDRDMTALAEPIAAAPAVLIATAAPGPLAVVGTGADLIRAVAGARPDTVYCDPAQAHPDAAVLARLAADRAPADRPGRVGPIYLRPPDAVPPR